MLSLFMNPSTARGTLRGPLAASPAGGEPTVDISAETAALRPLIRGVIAKVLSQGPTDPDVEDCTHEALRRALEGHSRLRPGEPVRPWVIGIAKHVALDALRARKKQRERHAEPRADEDDAPSPVDRVADSSPDPLETLERARRDRAVRDAMKSLPDGTREALTMFHMEGLGYQEIASRLGVPLGTVATWVTRGRKAMAGAIGKEVRET